MLQIFYSETSARCFRLVTSLPINLYCDHDHITGEVVLVTGAGHGIGREVALQMAKLGAIIICVDKNVESNKYVS